MRRKTLAGIGLVVALAAIPAIGLAQIPTPPTTTPANCPYHASGSMAAHAGVHQQMHAAAGTMMSGGGMQGMSGFGGMAGGAGMHQQMGSMMSQMQSMMGTGG